MVSPGAACLVNGFGRVYARPINKGEQMPEQSWYQKREHGYVTDPDTGEKLSRRCVYCGEHTTMTRLKAFFAR